MRRTLRLVVLSILPIFFACGHAHAATPVGESVTFTDASPLRSKDEMIKRSSIFGGLISPSNSPPGYEPYEPIPTQFRIVIPSGYQTTTPHGVFVWLGVADFPLAYLGTLASRKLILIVPDVTWMKTSQVKVTAMALDAVHNLSKRYTIDPDRLYLSGFSGGGLTAAMVLHAYPDVFHGAFFINGEDFYCNMRRSSDGRLAPSVAEYIPWAGPYDRIKQQQRLVILTGEKDTIFEPTISRGNYESLLMDGFTRVTYFEVPGGGHNLPDVGWFMRGLDALDHPRPKVPPTTGPTSDPNPSPSQVAQARRLYDTAHELVDGRNNSWGYPSARKYLQQVIDDYPTTPVVPKAKELLDWMSKNPPSPRSN